jgi:hypothetical protein
MLRIAITKLSPTRHRTSIVRADGTTDAIELETRSLLFHDFVHLAVETEAALRDGFFGRLSRGESFADLAVPMEDPTRGDSLMEIERVVGPLQAACRRELPPEAFHATLRAYLTAVAAPIPPWLSADLLRRSMAAVRRLDGEWRKLPIGATMELRFASA